MGVDLSTVKLLLWGKNLGVKFNRTVTLGRLGLVSTPNELRTTMNDFGFAISPEQLNRCFIREPFREVFADEFLRVLGAEEYVSVDRSDFEGANFLHDLNEPFPEKMRGQFDFILDGGTLEHIFNYPAALKHSMALLRPGGHFLTAAPANGHMGHGFYQFSPELFFRIFNAQNGFAIRKAILYETYRKGAQFYEVSDPAKLGNRVELNSSPPVSMVILAQKISDAHFLATPPQQSDYVAVWKVPVLKPDRSTFFRRLRTDLNPYWPKWLRSFKRKIKSEFLREPNPVSLQNRKSFRPLSMDEIRSERGG
jgi:SAM-dependent methyltransferase